MTTVPEDALISAREVTRTFEVGGQTVYAVHDTSVDVFPGEFVVLLGRSGSGKTTLLNLLGGLDRPSSGAVYFEGRDLATFGGDELARLRRDKLGFVFQSFGLLPLLSAKENIELPLRIAGASGRDRDSRTRDALEIVGLGHRTGHRPYELSGGEQQRVAIARALVHRPPVILADEPTAELDSVNSKAIFELMADVVDRERLTVVIATHDRLALDLAHRVLELEDGSLVSAREPPARTESPWAKPQKPEALRPADEPAEVESPE